MRLVLFTKKSFFDGSIVEAGEEMLISEDAILGAHMIDLATGLAGGQSLRPRPQVIFRADLAHDLAPDEIRAKATEEAIQRAEATRLQEAADQVALENPSTEPSGDGTA